MALLGPSGCGKTTALNCVAGLQPLSGGTISLGDRRIDELPPEKRGFGMVFQSYALFPHMTARRNVGFGLAMRKVPRREAEKRIDEALALVRLSAQADKLPGQMSGGQQQRVAIARAIVIRPPVVLMDEPLSNLDAKLRLEMRAEIRRIHEAIGSTTVYVTHDQDEALSMADRIVVMRDGLIRQTGTPAELYERPAHADVAEFMGYRSSLAGRVLSAANGRATVEACGSRLDVWVRDTVLPGEAVTLMVRPEDLVAGTSGVVATVRISEYRGPRLLRGRAGHRRHGTVLPVGPPGRGRRACDARRPPRSGSGLLGDRSVTAVSAGRPATVPLRIRLAARGLDGTTLLVLPALLAIVGLFIYPFLYGLVLSLQPKVGPFTASYRAFFADPFLRETVWNTLVLAIPTTLLNILLAMPIAFRVRLMANQRLLTTILVLPVTLGTVLVAQGLLTYLGPQGWFNRTLLALHVIGAPLKLTNNYWGVFASLVITGFPFTFLLTLSYVSGIDPALEQAAATLGAGAARRFARVFLPLLVPGLAVTFCLSFVQAFAVFPSAVLLGAPAGSTHVISIAAYQAAFERYDASLGSAIAMVMGAVQLVVVVLALGARSLFYRGPVGGTKG